MLIAMKYHPLIPAAVFSIMAVAAVSAQPTTTSASVPAAAEARAAQSNDRVVVMGILAAEFSLQNGDVATAAGTYYEVAKRSQDPKVAERAVELLLRSRRVDDAKEITTLWQAAEPESVRPLLVSLALALSSQDENGAVAVINRVIELPPDTRAGAISDVARQLAQYRDRDFAVKLASLFTTKLADVAESFYALAAASTGTNNARIGEGLLAIDRALAIRPYWSQAVALKARLLLARAVLGNATQTASPSTEARAAVGADAVALLESAIAANPDSRELRVLLARMLFDLTKFADARARFLALADDGAEDTDEMRLAATLSAFQNRDWESAEREFNEALNADRGDRATVLFYLARIAELQKRWSVAIERFAQVPQGERYWEAQLRLVGALAQDKRLLQAVSRLRAMKASTVNERLSLAQTESTLWRESGDYVSALAALDVALVNDADNPDLLYDSAMLAERIGRTELAENRLRRVITLQPSRAHAYNALGYSFADRNVNLDEARTLIEKAHQLLPDDPAILDSLGWVAFRQGRLQDAEHLLRRALAKFSDGEVAAHLGEVLWMSGRRDEARSIWQAQLAVQPDSEILKKTVARFEP